MASVHVTRREGLYFNLTFDLSPVLHLQRMLTSRPAPLTANRPLHARTPGKALQKARGILQENALQAPRTGKALRVELQTPLKVKGEYPITR
jgi:hypothetical protein